MRVRSRRVAAASLVIAAYYLGGGAPARAETHPFQEPLRCDRAPGSMLRGLLYDVSGGQAVKLGEFVSGHVGACERAIRAARGGRVCVNRNWTYDAIDIKTRQAVRSFGSDLDACLAFTKGWEPLATRAGYVQYIDERELRATLKHLPHVEDPEIDAVLHDAETMWYDEASMVFTYQDSSGNPQGPEGLRANRVAYDVGVTATHPDIRLLTEYFEHGRFRFPFAVAAGTGDQANTYVMNFWAPPGTGAARPPVVWWQRGSHWHWRFPVGTVIGEVLLTRAPDDGDWYVFEIRSRTRRQDGWTTGVFRPFTRAVDMAAAIKETRPAWQTSDLAPLVAHLENSASLTPASLATAPYQQLVPTFKGAYDYLPETTDVALIKSFFTERPFLSAMGTVWKEDGALRTYAAASHAPFHIVPRGYIGGLLETSEQACARCHAHGGRALGELNGRVSAYGEIWGEDLIFTWHPFQVTTDAFSVADGNRQVDPRLVQAGLVANERP